MDLFGFESHHENNLEQIFVNCFNEQIQYYYSQRTFAWETMEEEQDHVPALSLTYYDNKPTLDGLLGKPHGLLALVEEASRSTYLPEFILGNVDRYPTRFAKMKTIPLIQRSVSK